METFGQDGIFLLHLARRTCDGVRTLPPSPTIYTSRLAAIAELLVCIRFGVVILVKTQFLHQSSDWLGRWSPNELCVKWDVKPHYIIPLLRCDVNALLLVASITQK